MHECTSLQVLQVTQRVFCDKKYVLCACCARQRGIQRLLIQCLYNRIMQLETARYSPDNCAPNACAHNTCPALHMAKPTVCAIAVNSLGVLTWVDVGLQPCFPEHDETLLVTTQCKVYNPSWWRCLQALFQNLHTQRADGLLPTPYQIALPGTITWQHPPLKILSSRNPESLKTKGSWVCLVVACTCAW